MQNESLIQYIKSAQAQGFPEEAIRSVLAKNGWASSDIEDAFSYLTLSEKLPTPPLAPGHIPEPKVHIAASSQSAVSPKIEYNSPYSVGLAVVLFASLLILVNKFIDDNTLLINGPNQKLIFDALIILPFLIAAVILFSAFSENRRRFRIISEPYFVVSACLLVRLLWDTSLYVLSTSATYGVYIVLVMVILVLTGLVVFVRKFMIK